MLEWNKKMVRFAWPVIDLGKQDVFTHSELDLYIDSGRTTSCICLRSGFSSWPSGKHTHIVDTIQNPLCFDTYPWMEIFSQRWRPMLLNSKYDQILFPNDSKFSVTHVGCLHQLLRNSLKTWKTCQDPSNSWAPMQKLCAKHGWQSWTWEQDIYIYKILMGYIIYWICKHIYIYISN